MTFKVPFQLKWFYDLIQPLLKQEHPEMLPCHLLEIPFSGCPSFHTSLLSMLIEKDLFAYLAQEGGEHPSGWGFMITFRDFAGCRHVVGTLLWKVLHISKDLDTNITLQVSQRNSLPSTFSLQLGRFVLGCSCLYFCTLSLADQVWFCTVAQLIAKPRVKCVSSKR